MMNGQSSQARLSRGLIPGNQQPSHRSRRLNRDRPFRFYAQDSRQAKARLVVLAIMADGRLDVAELDLLAGRGIFDEIEISREEFFEVFYGFCEDVARLPNGSGNYLLSPAIIKQLLGEISSTEEKVRILSLILDVFHSDGHLADGEADLFIQAVNTWSFGGVGLDISRRSQ